MEACGTPVAITYPGVGAQDTARLPAEAEHTERSMDRAAAAKQKSACRAAFGCIPGMNAGTDPRRQRGGGPCNGLAAGFLCIDPAEESGVPEAVSGRDAG